MEDNMAGKSFVDRKSRSSLPGSGLGRVVDSNTWGEEVATKRYGGSTKTFGPPQDKSMPQFPEDQPLGKRYSGEISPNSWLRGGGGNGKPKR
jgi:hypothetical protein